MPVKNYSHRNPVAVVYIVIPYRLNDIKYLTHSLSYITALLLQICTV